MGPIWVLSGDVKDQEDYTSLCLSVAPHWRTNTKFIFSAEPKARKKQKPNHINDPHTSSARFFANSAFCSVSSGSGVWVISTKNSRSSYGTWSETLIWRKNSTSKRTSHHQIASGQPWVMFSTSFLISFLQKWFQQHLQGLNELNIWYTLII